MIGGRSQLNILSVLNNNNFMDPEERTNNTIGKWTVIEKIGDGSFGNVFSARPNTNESHEGQFPYPIAIKTVLCCNTQEDITNVKQMLLLEYQIYREFAGTPGFPAVLQYEQQETFSFLVMEKLQMTLDRYAASRFPDSFLPRDILLIIMRDTLRIIRQLHQKGYIYRDVKPANFMVKSPYDQIYIIDFGLCKRYQVNGRHIANKGGKKLVGTPVFCSLNTHAGIQQSRRDDIQSWLIMSLYLSTKLPWESVISRKDLTKEQQYEEIYKIKQNTNWDAIVEENRKQPNTNKIPSCIPKILDYARRMNFEEGPDYEWIEGLIAEQYRGVTNSPIEEKGLYWESKQIKREASPVKKIRKINFKIPMKNLTNKQPAIKVPQESEKENLTNVE